MQLHYLMSKVLLIDIDSKIPNLALKKIEKYFKDKGDEVIWNNELFATIADYIFVSCVFDWNKKKAQEFEGYNNALIGGSGYDIIKTLPNYLDAIKPRINIGFTTRGCIRKCPFCIVHEKEGKIKIEGDIYDIWDGKSKTIVLLDNNILALQKHFKLICSQLRKEKLKVDFNQGLDCRLLNEDIVNELKTIRTVDLRFAFDDSSYKKDVEKTIELFGKATPMWYVLVGFNTSFQNDLDRINFLRAENQRTYVMRHKNCRNKKEYIALARWNNSPLWKNALSFEDFCKRNKYRLDNKE